MMNQGPEHSAMTDVLVGPLIARPSFNVIDGPDGPQRVEPQVMQVFLLLARRRDEVVSREDIWAACWNNVAVSDDAIFRAVSRLRRVLRLAGGGIEIETVAKRGYCMRIAEPKPLPEPAALDPTSTAAPRTGFRRFRWGFAAIGVAVASLAVLFAWLTQRAAPTAYSLIPLARDAGPQIYPALSPDGRLLVYSSKGAGADHDLYLRPARVDGRVERLTASPAGDVAAAWSPDGAMIAYVERRVDAPCRLMVMRIASRTVRNVGGCSGVMQTIATWLNDRELVFADRYPNSHLLGLVRLNIATGRRRPLLAPSLWLPGDRMPVMGPDGRRLAFVRAASFLSNEIAVLDVRTQRVARWADGFSSISGLAWHPRGGLLVSGTRRGTDGLWLIPRPGSVRAASIGTGQVGRIAGGAGIIAEVATVWTNLFEISLDTGESRVLAPSTATDLHPTYSPDGREISFVSNRSGKPQIWSLRAGGSLRERTRLDVDGIYDLSYAPDGRSLLYFVVGLDGQASIRQLDLATGLETAVADSPLPKNSPVWLPDGRSIAYAEEGPNGWQVWRHDLLTGLRSAFGLSGYPLVRLAYDGSGLLLGDLVTSRIDHYGFASRKLTTLYPGRLDRDPYLWVASPRGLLFVARTTASDGELRLAAARERENVVTNLPGLNFYSAPALSPDGRRFITAQRTLSEVDLALVSESPSEPAVASAEGSRE